MAVLDSVPGLQVNICISGKNAKEYEDPHTTDSTSEKTTTKYIECVDDAEFSVVTKVNKRYAWGYKNHLLLTTVYIDGKYMIGVYVGADDKNKSSRISGVGSESGDCWVLRKFTFSPVKMIEAAQPTQRPPGKPFNSQLGIIEARVSRETEDAEFTTGTGVDHQHLIDKKLDLTEKSVKGQSISHGTTFLKTTPIAEPKFIYTGPIPEDNGPIATFRFIYRSQAALKEELIVPRSPSPDPLLGMTAEEVQRLARERISMPVQVKADVSVKRECDPVDLTIEDATASRKKARYESPIDLTDD